MVLFLSALFHYYFVCVYECMYACILKCLKDLWNHPRLSGLFTEAALSLAVSKNKYLQFYHCTSVSVLACLITLLIFPTKKQNEQEIRTKTKTRLNKQKTKTRKEKFALCLGYFFWVKVSTLSEAFHFWNDGILLNWHRQVLTTLLDIIVRWTKLFRIDVLRPQIKTGQALAM